MTTIQLAKKRIGATLFGAMLALSQIIIGLSIIPMILFGWIWFDYELIFKICFSLVGMAATLCAVQWLCIWYFVYLFKNGEIN